MWKFDSVVEFLVLVSWQREDGVLLCMIKFHSSDSMESRIHSWKGRNQEIPEFLPGKILKSYLTVFGRMPGRISNGFHSHILNNCIFFPTHLDLGICLKRNKREFVAKFS